MQVSMEVTRYDNIPNILCNNHVGDSQIIIIQNWNTYYQTSISVDLLH